MNGKQLSGIASTPQLESILRQICALNKQNKKEGTNKNNDEDVSVSGDEDGSNECEEKEELSVVKNALRLMPYSQAVDILKQHLDDAHNQEGDKPAMAAVIPLKVFRAAKSILLTLTPPQQDPSSACSNDLLLTQLEQALRNPSSSSDDNNNTTTLIYNSPVKEQRTKQEQKAYEERIQKLKLAQQERSYNKLTTNIDTYKPPDASIRGMMYATSIGLNMIVAPLSFAAFMYFFSGSLLNYFQNEEDEDEDVRKNLNNEYNYQHYQEKLDIRRVIVAVISGVFMMFVEMILFVIRNHEMDRHIAKKMKVDKPNSFGYVKRTAKRTYTGE